MCCDAGAPLCSVILLKAVLITPRDRLVGGEGLREMWKVEEHTLIRRLIKQRSFMTVQNYYENL